ncbi:hypothetical protein BDR04DRAFT_1114133 [Suillus decipiens]|nr:hypothetical protein BDR04DRAFT_1114133 [Suillus decipiens]
MGHSNRHDPEPKHSEPGILSNVFSFVSREIGEFMINATGNTESGPSKREQERKMNDRRKLSADGRRRARRGREKKDGKRRASSGSRSRSQSVECLHSQSQNEAREPSRSRTRKTKARTSSEGKQAKSRAKSADDYGRKKYRNRVYAGRPEDADGELTPSITSRSPSPRRTNHSRGGIICPRPKDPSSSQTNLPLPSSQSEVTYPQLRRKPSITMPGSLFPRSDSPQPDFHDEEMETMKERFLSASEDTHTHERNPNLVPRTPQSTFDINAQDSEPNPSNSPHETPADQIGPSPWRTRPIASVHDAVQRFTASGGEERDFSLLVVASPAGPIDPESPGVSLETAHPPLGSTSQKGKERAVDDEEDLAFILDRHRVQDKEKQLDTVRMETRAKGITTGDGERDRDKERIRMLEEEVRMLKEELSRRHCSPPAQTQVLIPPPPPPLPPPPGVRIPLPLHLGESRALFASARAALRPTEVSTTGSTNDLARSASELARARSSDRLAELGLENGEFFGTGTGSKRRGFLAGGGAGGAPVFMGAGGRTEPASVEDTAAESQIAMIFLDDVKANSRLKR